MVSVFLSANPAAVAACTDDEGLPVVCSIMVRKVVRASSEAVICISEQIK
jgi:hypothetical protein